MLEDMHGTTEWLIKINEDGRHKVHIAMAISLAIISSAIVHRFFC